MAPVAGAMGRVDLVVTEEFTAAAVGSGLVPGLSTPTMVGLMEGAAVAAIGGQLDEGTTTVGSRLEVEHLAPTPVGQFTSLPDPTLSFQSAETADR